MSDHQLARLMGLCFAVAGSCATGLFIHTIGFGHMIGLFATMFVGVVVMVIALLLLGLTMVGFIWMARPWRAIDTIRRNKAVSAALAQDD